ncbi:stalk domain-containing protein [Ammoniphilus sp. YIM 78166]|uniref:stalk domain-containing protein n=1 Tax=Ammoniphilus sp. YIM 78166 TaxID=1644106 RepID=UPI00106FD68B|nr:stalk domain-containing protein [Ammoniphilus sp. YIM 78166]
MQIKPKYIVAGLLASSLLFAGTGYTKALTEKITARFANIQLIVNEQVIQTKAEPFIYNGNVYAPVATVANMLGIKQEWDNSVPAVRFSTSPLKRDENPNWVGYSSMGEGIYLISMKEWPGEYTLDDKGKRIKIPHTAETAITHVTPFLNLTGQSYPEEFLVVESEKNAPHSVYFTVYQYHEGQVRKIYSTKLEASSTESNIHFTHEGGHIVYFHEFEHDHLVDTQAYRWDMNKRTYQKVKKMINE